MIRHYQPAPIEYPRRYQEAIEARIKANARKGRGQRWFAEDETRKDLVEWLETSARGDFAAKMADSYREWGTLTEGQERAVRKMRDEAAGKAAARSAADAQSEFVGEVGKRATFAGLTVVGVYEDEGGFGPQYSCKFRDAAGALYHWRASGHRPGVDTGPSSFRALDRGDIVTLKATVKAHHTSKTGVKSTILTRAKVEAVEAATALAQAEPQPTPGAPRKRLTEEMGQ